MCLVVVLVYVVQLQRRRLRSHGLLLHYPATYCFAVDTNGDDEDWSKWVLFFLELVSPKINSSQQFLLLLFDIPIPSLS